MQLNKTKFSPELVSEISFVGFRNFDKEANRPETREKTSKEGKKFNVNVNSISFKLTNGQVVSATVESFGKLDGDKVRAAFAAGTLFADKVKDNLFIEDHPTDRRYGSLGYAYKNEKANSTGFTTWAIPLNNIKELVQERKAKTVEADNSQGL